MIEFPADVEISSVTWMPQYTVSKVQSPFSLQPQFYEWSGQRWEADITMPPMDLTSAKKFRGFLLRLKSGIELFHMAIRADRKPTYAISENIKVAKLPTEQNTLSISGGKPNTLTFAGAGDWFSINNYLFMVQEDASTDGSGNANLSIFPSIQANIKIGDPVEFNNPVGTFRTTDNIDLPSVEAEGIAYPMTWHIQHVVYNENRQSTSR